ncbi:hypothetical protein H2200_006524 [Cladophialophora chaetospira]|uniref:Uncharacterized protein n=1 Tax=Cladophialophora chaetospira TaxID=386627 RepID=A0AA38X8D0_9EURO|nr:hypothetical protein H2200_006524 [Cladophialophora chaetospira]
MRKLGIPQLLAWTAILLTSFCLIRLLIQQRRPGSAWGAPYLADAFTEKPPGLIVRGLVFYGRRDRAEILQCYLERNLVDQGGWLDEVIWVLNTTVDSDITYLQQLLASEPRYRLQEVRSDGLGIGFHHAYDGLAPSSLYIKIDDDVVWIGEDTISRLVLAKLNHPEHLIVSANTIDSPLMSKIHLDRGAHRPYLPAVFQNTTDITTTWDYTEYPRWDGPSDYRLTWMDWVDPSVPWLPAADIASTPIVDVEYDPWGNALTDWKLGCQAHLSLLQNIRDDTLSAYYHDAEEFHYTDGKRLSINFIAFLSDDILPHLPFEDDDDELWLTVSLPAKLSKQVVVENRALAAHFSFSYQHHLEKTDALARYKQYAKLHGCEL